MVSLRLKILMGGSTVWLLSVRSSMRSAEDTISVARKLNIAPGNFLPQVFSLGM